MNDNFENQKEKLLSIKHEISLLHQQVSYLLRNEKALGLLDLDVLMNRTHTIYDQICAIQLGEEATDDDFDIAPEALAGIFGDMLPEENAQNEEPETEPEDEPETEPEDEPEFEPEPEPQPDEIEQDKTIEEISETAAEPQAESPENENKPEGDEFGFFFRFEDDNDTIDNDTPENETPEDEQPAVIEPVEIDGKLVYSLEEIPEEEIPERDRVSGEDLVTDNPFEMPKMEDEIPENEEPEPEPTPEPEPEPIPEPEPEPEPELETPSANGLLGYFDNDDTEFELTPPETIGERMMHDDHSLASKLQQNPICDLREVIGINDKFLFVNELFGGSMEKYNKSIENLNDLKTYNGAMIYLNELKIELQWNSSNEAYQKLAELVRRKFEQA